MPSLTGTARAAPARRAPRRLELDAVIDRVDRLPGDFQGMGAHDQAAERRVRPEVLDPSREAHGDVGDVDVAAAAPALEAVDAPEAAPFRGEDLLADQGLEGHFPAPGRRPM